MATGRTHGRRAAAASLAGVVAASFVVLVLGSSAAVADDDVQLKHLHHGREDRVGEPVDVSAKVHGDDCAGTVVAFSFVGGPETAAAAEERRHGDCEAKAMLQIPLPAECDGAQRDGMLTLRASIPDVAPLQQDLAVRCPSAPPPSPPAPPPPPPSPPTPTPTAHPTPTTAPRPTPTPATSQPVPPGTSPGPSSVFQPPVAAPVLASAPGVGAAVVAASTEPTPSEQEEEQPVVARKAALLVPVDDGGPRPPTSGRGLFADPVGPLLVLVVLAAGGSVLALVWQRGTSRAVVGGVIASTLVLASAPPILADLTTGEAAGSTALRIRTIAVDQVVAPGTTASAAAPCPAGSVLVGGGVRSAGAGASGGVISLSVPSATGWAATATAPTTEGLTLTAVALCTTDTGLRTDLAASVAASLAEGDTGRTQARCLDGGPLAVGWSGQRAPAVAALPLLDGATSIAWGAQGATTSLTNVLCTAGGSTAYPVRHDSDQVPIAADATGSAAATCGPGARAVGGGYVAAANVGGRVAPVTVVSAAPDGEAFEVEVVAHGTGVLLTAYALCVPGD